MKKIIIGGILGLCIGLAAGMIIYFYPKEQSRFDCTVRFNTTKDDFTYRLVLTFIDDSIGNEGIVLIQGTERGSENIISNIHRKIFFNYSEKDNNFFMTNQGMENFPDDDLKNDEKHFSHLIRTFPDFYLTKGATINIGIYPTATEDKILVNGRTHVLFCNHIELK